MRFLWKTQLKQERGRFVQKEVPARKKTRKSPVPPSRTGLAIAGVLLLWGTLLSTVAYLVLFSPYLALSNPVIDGRDRIESQVFEDVLNQELHKKYLGKIDRQRFFLLRPRALEQVLRDRFPLIREVTVSRTFPDRFSIALTERSALLLWCIDTCFHIREDGTVMPKTAVYDEEANQVRTITIRDESLESIPSEGVVFDPSFVALPSEIRTALEEELGIETSPELRVTSRFSNELRVRTVTGWEIYFATDLPVEKSLSALSLLLEKEISSERQNDLLYIDLRTENRVFYRFQEGKETKVPEVVPEPAKEVKKKEKK